MNQFSILLRLPFGIKQSQMIFWKVFLPALLAIAHLSFGQTLPPNFSAVTVASGFTSPTVAAFSPDGRIFVGQQAGALRVVKNGTLLTTPFVSLSVSSSGERGLLGVTFDPDFATNQYVYVFYTVPASGTVAAFNRVSRFTANGDVAVPNSESIILNLPALGATNHNGGSIAFGPDNKLYVATGDNAVGANSQNLNNYLGKILRINADGSVPSGNPFTGNDARQRIWAYGLRNPYSITFQPGTGRLFVNDVGEGTWEEINDATVAGRNFGWPSAEGVCSAPSCATFTNPVYAYPHSGTGSIGCSITGGAFYNPTVLAYPDSYVGKYFFTDFCSGWMDVLDLSGPTAVNSRFATGLPGQDLTVFLGPDGHIYDLNRGQGKILKFIYSDCKTIAAGNWHNSAIWNCGRVPLSSDMVTVGHAVTIDTNLEGQATKVQYLGGGQITLYGTGKLRLGF
ncbi:hypothetical protein GCM10028807_12810 [Spirosoma daeguense]